MKNNEPRVVWVTTRFLPWRLAWPRVQQGQSCITFKCRASCKNSSVQWVELEYFINSPDGCLLRKLKNETALKALEIAQLTAKQRWNCVKVSFDASMRNVHAQMTKTLIFTLDLKPWLQQLPFQTFGIHMKNWKTLGRKMDLEFLLR